MTNQQIEVQQELLEKAKEYCDGRGTCKDCSQRDDCRAYAGGCLGRAAVNMLIEERAKSGWVGAIADVLEKYNTPADVDMFEVMKGEVQYPEDTKLPMELWKDVATIIHYCWAQVMKNAKDAKERTKK